MIPTILNRRLAQLGLKDTIIFRAFFLFSTLAVLDSEKDKKNSPHNYIKLSSNNLLSKQSQAKTNRILVGLILSNDIFLGRQPLNASLLEPSKR